MMNHIMMSFYLMMALIIMFTFMSIKKMNFNQKKTSFECGLKNMLSKKSSFSTNFLMMVMMFLIFDIEVSFLIPLNMMIKNNINSNSMMILAFLLLLTMVLKKEWKQGSLDWNK